ncbi:MAG: hypothetical protein C4547_05315 [Phycisphaerales bacterium]|nr:MAG: hypothetical protein C4547_05315 [Phycisphaerales bacterium]
MGRLPAGGRPFFFDLTQEAAYQAHLDNAEIARQICELRTGAGLTQRALAKLVGATASAISRIEDADYQGHCLSMLRRVAAALDARVEVRFVRGTDAGRSGRSLSQAR